MAAQDSTAGVTSGPTALDAGRAFVDRSPWLAVLVTGRDAEGWLHDLVTAGIEGLAPGETRRSLLLTPTGRIRADLHVARLRVGFLLLQDREQPEPVATALAPYVLSSDVSLEDRTGSIALLCSTTEGLELNGAESVRPSVLGVGTDLVGAADRRSDLVRALRDAGMVEVDEDAVDAWRIRRGDPRFGVDLGTDGLPAEAGLEWTIDLAKGCFLGQESVARVRNLGHPPRVLLRLRADGAVVAGAAIASGDEEVGRVTSAAPNADGTDLLALVRWEARESPLTAGGTPLQRR